MNLSDPHQPSQDVSLAEISYIVAYFVLPRYAYTRLEKIEELYQNNPVTAGPFFYAMACNMRKVTPNRADADQFSWKVGELDDQTDFFVMLHPEPAPVDFSSSSSDDVKLPVLPPYFSGIFRNRQTQKVSYYVLGPNPLGEGTTLRSVTLDPYENSNLGPGPDADVDSFLASIAFRIE
jgi:hypothetical protein